MTAAKHTPTLRYLRLNGTAADLDIVNEHGGRVASTPYEPHAERICRTYNSHDALVAALEQANDVLTDSRREHHETVQIAMGIVGNALAALKAAKAAP